MQGYGGNDVRLGNQIGTGAPHPGREFGRCLGTVPVLEGQHQFAARRVIDHGGTGALEGRRLANAFSAEGPRPGVILERQHASVTIRRRDEPDAVPAGGAKSPRRIDDGVAAQTLRGQDRIKGAARDIPPRRGKAPS